MKDKEYFSTAEFASIANISKQTLIYYDNSGIFHPIYKDENNFRYYSLEQFEALDTLISLKDIGVPLKEIKEYLTDKNIESLVTLMKSKKEMIEKQINNLIIIRGKIENKTSKLEKVTKSQHITEPYFKTCDTEYVFVSKVDSDDYKEIMIKISNFIKCIKGNERLDNGNSIGGIIKKKEILKGNFKSIKYIYTKVDSKNINKDIRVKSGGIYACINHRGSYDTTHISYNKLVNFIEDNGYKIIGDSYEDELIGYLLSKSKDEYLIHLSILVEKHMHRQVNKL